MAQVWLDQIANQINSSAWKSWRRMDIGLYYTESVGDYRLDRILKFDGGGTGQKILVE